MEAASAPLSVAGCQVVPPSVETSTPATTSPGALVVAVPVIVEGAPSGSEASFVGLVMTELGGVVLEDSAPGTRPDMRVAGCTPIMANRFTTNCCMFLSAGPLPCSMGFQGSRPHENCTVPAPNTNAPLAAL